MKRRTNDNNDVEDQTYIGVGVETSWLTFLHNNY